MSTMITGSVAYDTILTHNGRFADKLEKGDLRHVNLTFLAPEMHRDFGAAPPTSPTPFISSEAIPSSGAPSDATEATISNTSARSASPRTGCPVLRTASLRRPSS